MIVKCPLHNEKTGSMAINLEDNRYHCFGCGEMGKARDLFKRIGSDETHKIIDLWLEGSSKPISADVYVANYDEKD